MVNATSQNTVLGPLKKYVIRVCICNCMHIIYYMYMYVCDMRLCELPQCPDDRTRQDGADCANSQVNSNNSYKVCIVM